MAVEAREEPAAHREVEVLAVIEGGAVDSEAVGLEEGSILELVQGGGPQASAGRVEALVDEADGSNGCIRG